MNYAQSIRSNDELLTPERVAEFLGVSVGTLAQWRARGVGPRFVHAGAGRSAVRYWRSDVLAHLERGQA